MSLHLNLSTGKFLNSSTLFKLSDALLLDVSSGEIVMSNLLVPRAVSVSSSPTLFGDATLDLNFASSLSLDDAVSGNNLVTFSRASTGTYVGSDGLIKTSVVNLLPYSEQFDNGAWAQGAGVTVTDNTDTAPDGTLTADTFSSSSGNQISTGFIPVTASTTYTSSIYIKKTVGRAYTAGIVFNYDAGTLYGILLNTNDGTTVETTYTVPTTVLVQNSGEYWRISLTANSGSSVNVRCFIYPNMNASTAVSAGSQVIWGAQVEEGSTATTYIPTTTTSSGAPRFDHDPVTGESLGLLIEESRTNFIYPSIVPSSTSGLFTVDGAAVTTNAGTAPDGTNTASLVEQASGTGNNRIYSFTGGIVRDEAYSFFVKASSPDAVFGFTFSGSTSPGGQVTYTFSTGTVSGSFTGDVSVESYPNGWVRLSTTSSVTSPTTTSSYVSIIGFTGDFFIWGLQREAGSFQSSYIPTTTSAVTRAADLASIQGTNFSSWYNQSEGTVFIKGSTSDLDANTGWSSFFQASSPNNNRISIRVVPTLITSTGTTVALSNSASPTVNETEEIAFAYKENDFAQYTSYANPVFLGTGLTPVSVDTLLIASVEGTGSDFNLNGHLSRLTYFPTRKSDEDLVSLTLPTVITYGITSPGGVFNLRSLGTVDYEVDWELTGVREASTENVLPHTYTAGNHTLAVYSGGVYRPYFNNVTADASQITSVVIGSGADLGTNLSNAWFGATNMTSFVCPFDVTNGVTSFYVAWINCASLTSFPLIDTSSGSSFQQAWQGCSSLTSFPLINTSLGTNFGLAWYVCSSLADFPANMFDTTGTLSATAFNAAWVDCALTAQSIENILVSLDTNGASNITLGINGGTNAGKTTWSTAAVTAYDNLIVKGWTISFNA